MLLWREAIISCGGFNHEVQHGKSNMNGATGAYNPHQRGLAVCGFGARFVQQKKSLDGR